jgi:hypothetical protein
MGGIIFHSQKDEKDQVGLITKDNDRKSIDDKVKNNILRRLWVDSDCVKTLDWLYRQKKIQQFSDTIIGLLNDPRRWARYMN